MYPILISWGPVVLPAWHTLYALGAVLAFLILVKLARTHHPDIAEVVLSRLFIACYTAGYFGARFLSILIEEPETKGFGAIVASLFKFGGMTFYGGALAAFLGGAVCAKVMRVRIGDLIDLSIPAGLAALCMGRIGCFLNGDDYGLPVPVAEGLKAPVWAVVFPNLQDGVPRYPVQLYEAVGAGLLAVILIAAYPRIRRGMNAGGVGFLGIVAYANLRFFLEFLRGDFRGSILFDWLSTSQFISVCVLILAVVSLPFWMFRRRSANRPRSKCE